MRPLIPPLLPSSLSRSWPARSPSFHVQGRLELGTRSQGGHAWAGRLLPAGPHPNA